MNELKMHYFVQNIRICYWNFLRGSATKVNYHSFRYKSFHIHTKLLRSLIGCTYYQAYAILQKHPDLQRTDPGRIIKTAEMLKKIGIGCEEMKEFPKVLTILPVTVEQHSLVLKESGFPNITAYSIINYRILVKKKISLLKAHGFLHEGANVSKNFLICLEAPDPVKKCVEKSTGGDSNNATVSSLRDLVLGCYLQWLLGTSENKVEHIFTTYPRIRNKSLQFIHETLSILLEELHFPKRHITEHGYLIHAHPHDLRRILKEFPTLGGMPMRDYLYKHPIVAVTSYETFSQILQILHKTGISQETILQTPSIFTLSVKNMRQGIALLDPKTTPPEIRVLHSHPKMLRLVVHHDNVSQRLAYLSSSDRTTDLPQVASLNLLCGSRKMFERYVTEDGVLSKGTDVVNYLVKALESDPRTTSDGNLVTAATVRDSLRQHAHWRNVPLAEVQSCMEMLLNMGFTCKEIMFSLQIVLYSSNRVKALLKNLSERSELSHAQITRGDAGLGLQLSGGDEKSFVEVHSKCRNGCSDSIADGIIPPHLRKHALPLCLYFLEKDHGFSGDGIWFRQ